MPESIAGTKIGILHHRFAHDVPSCDLNSHAHMKVNDFIYLAEACSSLAAELVSHELPASEPKRRFRSFLRGRGGMLVVDGSDMST